MTRVAIFLSVQVSVVIICVSFGSSVPNTGNKI